MLALLLFGGIVHAQTPAPTNPPPPKIPTPAQAAELVEPPITPPEPVILRRSPGWAAIHVLGVNVAFSAIGLTVLDKDYLKISPRTIWDNVRGGWAWDDDAFTTNQFGHPYFGNLAFNAARSNGIGFWGSALASFAGSLFWELVMENATPSINDQLFTPAGGIMLGESLFRLGEAIRWRDRSFPSRALAAIVDPMGAVSRWTHGDAYALAPPPPHFGFLSFGWNGLSVDLGAARGERFEGVTSRIHGAIYQTYGIPLDASFRPRRPLDHFDLLVEGDYGEDESSASLHVRGLLWGRAARLQRGGAIGGVMATYDFANLSPTRISAVSLGLGGLAHRPIGDEQFLQAGIYAGVIPYGGAGINVLADPSDGESSHSSYHRGPGAQGTLDLRLGWRDHGLAYLTGRGYYINGNVFDDGSEWVSHLRVGLIIGVVAPHAFQIEGMLASRSGRFTDGRRDVFDSTAQLRISYTFVSDFDFGGGPATDATPR
ncbi:MAG: DUF3943 domain-containing protein [Kofleriaceae bacterium]|nr:DUF3943 domain-containing protein [Kofleriaceae bacterium]